MIKDSGAEDIHLNSFRGLVPLDTQTIFNEIERQYNYGKDKDFIRDTIEGGIDFNSTDKLVNVIKNIMLEKR